MGSRITRSTTRHPLPARAVYRRNPLYNSREGITMKPTGLHIATKPTRVQIVLIEDNPADVILARMTLDAVRLDAVRDDAAGNDEADCSYGLTVLTDGARAIAYFEDENNPRPDL